MHTDTFVSQGSTFFYREWQARDARAVLVIVHGHGEHSGRYEPMARYLVESGISVFAFDHYGHGKSEGKRGHMPSYATGLDSIGAILDLVHERTGELPVFLYGHSMGGNFVANFVLRRNPGLAGVILSSPWLRLAFEPSAIQLLLARIMKHIYPSLTQSSKLDASAISRDPAEVKAYIEDPLVHDKISPVLFDGCVEGGKWALAHASAWKLPLLLTHGTADRLTSLEASREFAAVVPGDLDFREWEGAYHEPHNDLDREQVLEYLRTWILNQLKS